MKHFNASIPINPSTLPSSAGEEVARSRTTQRGFSLIELMTCIIIIALLSSFAVPLYKNHVNRARLLEGLALVEPVKITLQDIGLSQGFEKIKNNASAGVAPPESFAGESVESLTVLEGGKIEVAYHHPEGKLLFTPQESAGILRWGCESETESFHDFLPVNCKPLSSS